MAWSGAVTVVYVKEALEPVLPIFRAYKPYNFAVFNSLKFRAVLKTIPYALALPNTLN